MRVVIFSFLVLLTACVQQKKNTESTKRGLIKYAKQFNIIQRSSYVELQLLDPNSGKLAQRYALIQSGSKPRLGAGIEPLHVPVKNMAALSTTHLGMLLAIGGLSHLKGTTSSEYIANEGVKKGIKTGKIAEFDSDNGITPERLIAKKISLIVYSGFGTDFPNASKLKQLGILTMPNYDWREAHPLGKAEWIKLFGYLINQPQRANDYFKQVERAYLNAKKSIAKANIHPRVLMGSLIGGVWYAPAGGSYMSRILKDAGADYLYTNTSGTGSHELTLEQVFRDQLKSDFWFHPGVSSRKLLKEQQGKYALFQTYKKNALYCYTNRSSYFWEMGAVNPHWILMDIAHIIGTSKENYTPHFYEQLIP